MSLDSPHSSYPHCVFKAVRGHLHIAQACLFASSLSLFFSADTPIYYYSATGSQSTHNIRFHIKCDTVGPQRPHRWPCLAPVPPVLPARRPSIPRAPQPELVFFISTPTPRPTMDLATMAHLALCPASHLREGHHPLSAPAGYPVTRHL